MVFMQQKFTLENTTITIQYHNAVLTDTFDKIKVELQAFLRQELQNDYIKLATEQLEASNEKMIYTNKEKFDYLAEKYPVVKLLQQKLSLDPDY